MTSHIGPQRLGKIACEDLPVDPVVTAQDAVFLGENGSQSVGIVKYNGSSKTLWIQAS